MSDFYFDVTENVNPAFKEVWISDKPYNVLKGGRNSFKSSVIALKLVMMMIDSVTKDEQVSIVVIRKVANTIRDSVFAKIWWAINKMGVGDQFEDRKSPYKIFHKQTGSTFHFYGQDDFAKLKSNEIGNVIAVWYEEAAEFKDSEEFDQSNSTFMRQKHPDYPYVQIFWSYNPPRNPYSWINEWTKQLLESINYLVHSSSYLDDELGFVTEQMLEEIERIKKNDLDYYRYLYLGESVGLGTNVYNFRLFDQVDRIPDDERIKYLYFAMDSGHQQSATTCLAIVLCMSGNVYVVDNYYYSPAGKVNKKAPSQLTRDLIAFTTKTQKNLEYKYKRKFPVRKRTIDSAEGALRNEYYTATGIRWNPVAKKTKIVMTEYVQTLLAQGRMHIVTTNNNVKYFLEEHKTYRWVEESLEQRPEKPEVVKSDDHTCDALQYFVMDNAQDLNLQV